MDWVKGFIIPIIELTVIGGFISYIGFYVVRGLKRSWDQQTKWILKYKIPFLKKKYPEETIKWCMDQIDQGIGYYDAKKLLFIHNGNNLNQIYETMFIYDQLVMELSRDKTRTKEEKEDGRKLTRCYSKDQTAKLPTTSTSNSTSGETKSC